MFLSVLYSNASNKLNLAAMEPSQWTSPIYFGLYMQGPDYDTLCVSACLPACLSLSPTNRIPRDTHV